MVKIWGQHKPVSASFEAMDKVTIRAECYMALFIINYNIMEHQKTKIWQKTHHHYRPRPNAIVMDYGYNYNNILWTIIM